MSVGTDIKQAYIEVGLRYDVMGKISGEFLMIDNSNVSQRSPLIEGISVIQTSLPFDTKADSGDILVLSGEYPHILLDKETDYVENETIEHIAMLARCNVSGELRRFSGESRDDQYRLSPVYEVVYPVVYGLLVESMTGGGLRTERVGQVTTVGYDLYVPSSYDIKPLDRYEPLSGEYYQIESIKKRRFTGVNLAFLSEDTR